MYTAPTGGASCPHCRLNAAVSRKAVKFEVVLPAAQHVQLAAKILEVVADVLIVGRTRKKGSSFAQSSLVTVPLVPAGTVVIR